MKNTTVTLTLKAFRKLKKKLKKANEATVFYKEKAEKAEETARSTHRRELSMIEMWDQHSHSICDVLGDEYYHDDGAGFDYDNMIKGITMLRAKLETLRKFRAQEQIELEALRTLFEASKVWAAQGSRSRLHTETSLKLWDTVRKVQRFYERPARQDQS